MYLFGDGSICGPLCSVRSWLVVHLVLLLFDCMYFIFQFLMFCELPTHGDTENPNKNISAGISEELIQAAANDEYMYIMYILTLTRMIFTMVWSIVGCWTICQDHEKGLILYAVFAGLNLVLVAIDQFCLIRYGVNLIEHGWTEADARIHDGPDRYAEPFLNAVSCSICPLFCFFCCRPKMLSRFADPSIYV